MLPLFITDAWEVRQRPDWIQPESAELSVVARKSDCLAVRTEIGGPGAGYVTDRQFLLLDVPNYAPAIFIAYGKIARVGTEAVRSQCLRAQ
jgi:hypothetical protein